MTKIFLRSVLGAKTETKSEQWDVIPEFTPNKVPHLPLTEGRIKLNPGA